VPKLPDFEGKNSEIAIFRQRVPAGHQNIAGFLKFSTFLSDLTGRQILANIPLVTIASVATSQTAFFFFFLWLAIHT